MSKLLRIILYIIAGGILLLLVIQLIPLKQENPAVVTQVRWDSPQTSQLFERACADCHSNQTVWPWYSKVAPISWLVTRDVNEGRSKFNISNLQGMESRRLDRLPREIEEVIKKGEMPMGVYIMIHPTASLSADEKQALIDGLQKTLSNTLVAK